MRTRARFGVMGPAFMVCLLLASAVAEADTLLGTFSGANGGRTATAAFSISGSGDRLTIGLENTTAAGLTTDATYLLTGLSFCFSGGGTPGLTYLSGDAKDAKYHYIDVAANGAITPNSNHTSMDWSLGTATGDPLVMFNPKSNKSIIGHEDVGGGYGAANGSIGGNSAHNPFTYRKGEIVLGVTGWSGGLKVTGVNFFFGTDYSFQTVPLPAPALLGLGLLAGIGLVANIRRRRRRGI